jgi:hypothetical protein
VEVDKPLGRFYLGPETEVTIGTHIQAERLSSVSVGITRSSPSNIPVDRQRDEI